MGNTSSAPQTSSQKYQEPPQGCPVDHKNPNAVPAARCPVDHSIDPRNQMPTNLEQTPAVDQVSSLSSERVQSSIPKSFAAATDDSSTSSSQCPVDHSKDDRWEYPSPQQFYHALRRKNKGAPEEHIDMMVQIHNFLNERAWAEIIRWEDRWTGGKEPPQLSSFKGRPQELSPKARYHLFLSKLFPNIYSSEPPFDRHDWTVFRPLAGSSHRYVIDYYSAPDDEEGNPVFSLDVRPALDSPSAIFERFSEWTRVKKETYFSTSKSQDS